MAAEKFATTIQMPMLSKDERGTTYRLPLIDLSEHEVEHPYLFCSVNPKKGTLRGFHMQEAPHEETKLISCLSGSIFLAVFDPGASYSDRKRLETFVLEDQTGASATVGPGLATAWLTLTKGCVVLYQILGEFSPTGATGFRFDDPLIGVDWPLKPRVLAQKDLSWPLLNS